PGTGMTISRQRHINDPRINTGRVLRRKSKTGDRTSPGALRKNIRLRQQVAQGATALLGLELDKARELAAPGIDGEPGDGRKVGTCDQEYISAVDGKRTAGNGPGDHPRQIEHANP